MRSRTPVPKSPVVVAVVAAALAWLALSWRPALADDVKVAVAANFTEPARELAPLFEKKSGHKLILSFGATGQFYAQISQGAPFEVLLAADQATPAKAMTEGFAVTGTQATYAVGKLVLYSKTDGLVEGAATLSSDKILKIAIANPALAPYGAAAVETLKALSVYDALTPKLVQGSSIAQTYEFIATGNADAGFVALSQVAFVPGGSRWLVPEKLYKPIAQDAVLLKPGAASPAAKAFLDYLKQPDARNIIRKYGYGTGG